MIAALFEIITVGLPFCAFKIIAGLGLNQNWLTVWGALDLAINSINMLSLLLVRKRLLDACLLSLAIRAAKHPKGEAKSLWQDLGNSVDVLLSFALVAFMLGGGFLPTLAPLHLQVWNASVILNVLGAGSSRLSQSIEGLKQGR